MNLFNLFGTGNDLNTGSFVTLNGKEWRESITDFRKAFSEANDIGVTKKGTLFSWLTGNFNNDYDFVKDLDADTEALKKFKDAYTNESSLTFKKKNESFDATLKNSSVILQDFVKHTDKANISVENFFSSVTGAGKLTNAIKGIGLQMLTTAAQAAAIWAITEGFRLAVNAVQDYVNRAEIAKEKMEESKQAYRFTMTSTNFGSNSMPRHTWSVFSPAISVEPLPRNGWSPRSGSSYLFSSLHRCPFLLTPFFLTTHTRPSLFRLKNLRQHFKKVLPDFLSIVIVCLTD